MTTVVTGPDGAQITFPDGVSEQEMNAAMAKAYPAPAAASKPLGTMAGVSAALEGGLPGMDRAIAAGKSYLPPSLGGNSQGYATNLATEQAKQSAFQKTNPATAAVGALTAGAPLALLPGGAETLPGRVAVGAGEGAGIGAVSGALSSPDLSSAQKTLGPALAGASIGAAAGSAAPLATGLANRAITPLPISGSRQNAVDLLKANDVPLSAGDVTGRRGLQALEDQGLGATRTAAKQNQAFTKAVTEAAEMPAETALSGDIATNKNVIGRAFTNLSARNQIIPDKELRDGIEAAISGPGKLIHPSNEVQKVADRLLAASQDQISGNVYKNYHTELTNQAYALGKTGNPADANAYRGMRDALDAAMDRSIAANNPEDLGKFQTARRQWANLQPIAKVAAGTKGDAAAEGYISPLALQNALKSGNNLNYAAQEGPLDALAKAGTSIGIGALAPQSNITRYLMEHALGAAAGGALGYSQEGTPGALAGIALGPKVLGTVARAPGVQQYLANQLMTKAPRSAITPSALAAFLAQRTYGNAP